MKKLLIALLPLFVLLSCKDNDHVKPDNQTPPQTPGTPSPNPPGGSNDLEDLPKDTGGQLQPVVAGSDSSPFGYYIYTPSGYTSNGPKFPLLIFLHGSGEVGNSGAKVSDLDKVLLEGPPYMIKQKTWNPKYPMVVVAPQDYEDWWDPIRVNEFILFMTANYRVDPARVYVTGLSMGASGVYDLITSYGTEAHVAAAVPIVGGIGEVTQDKAVKAAPIPLWAFHSEGDLIITPDYDKAIVRMINDLKPAIPAKLTMYPGIDHEVWHQTYDGTGMGTEDPAYTPFDKDIYTWMLQYKLVSQ